MFQNNSAERLKLMFIIHLKSMNIIWSIIFITICADLTALLSCTRHDYEIMDIRFQAASDILNCQKQGGDIFTQSFAFSYSEAAHSLVKYKYRYSQYSDIFHELINCSRESGKPALYNGFAKLSESFLDLYNNCVKKHANMASLYERGRLYFDKGMYEECISDICSIIDVGNSSVEKVDKKKKLEFELIQGEIEIQLNDYEKAIKTLTSLLNKDPSNKDAYFCRAHAYFESGLFEEALLDYLNSEKSKNVYSTKSNVKAEFSDALIKGIVDGGVEAASEFIPCMCESAYGISECLWSFTQEPLESSVNFCNKAYEVAQATHEYINSLDEEKISGIAIEVKNLFQNFNLLNEREKGQAIGYCIGKYGVGIFAGGATIKCVSSFKNLVIANKVSNFECLSKSVKSHDILKQQALKHANERQAFFSKAKINLDKQNKHVVGKHNYEHGKSVFNYPYPDKLLKDFAGKGRTISKSNPGDANYKEIVDFKINIGVYINESGSQSLPTTKGVIHYSKSGSHIVPAHPDTRIFK